MNSTGGHQLLMRDTFAMAFMKNFIVVLVWLLLSYINGSVVATFFRHQIFYEDPRYILFIHMVINDAVQLTVTIALFVVSYILYTISVGVCCFFVLVAVFTTRSTPVNLAGMAIERYVAICYPLRHAQICTVRRAYMLIAAIWQNVFKDPVLLYKRQAFDGIYFSLVFLTLLCTYLRIVFAARALSTERTYASRATNTILLHGVQLLMCMLSYVSPSVEGILNIIFPGRILEIRFANYLIVYILPRFLSPIIYGVRDKKFRKYLRRYFVCSLTRIDTRVECKDEED